MNNSNRFSLVTTALFGTILVAGLALLAGCPSNSDSSTSATPIAQSAALSGTVFGGRQPVVGSLIKVYTAGQGGTPAVVIGTATTDAQGNFNIATFSPVPATGAVVYVTAAGGDGSGNGTANTAILMGTVAGVCVDYGCSNLTNVKIDEVSTAGMAYSMGGFTSITGTSVDISVQGSGTSSLAGITNAAGTFAKLVDAQTGTVAVPGATGCTGGSSDPVNCAALLRLNTLANIAAACVDGTDASSGTCTSLFSVTTTGAGVVPSNVYQALYAVATDAGVRNDGSLFLLNPATKIYSPSLNVAPAAWTLALNYTGNSLNNPAGLAIDAQGAVWLTNTSDDTISKFGNDGSALGNFTNAALDGIHDIAIDRAGNVWVTSQTDLLGLIGGSINKFDNNGTFIGNYAGGLLGLLLKLGNPQGIVIGPAGGNGKVWVTSSGALNFLLPTLTSFNNAGTELTSLSLQGLISSDPRAIAIDANANVWIADGSEAVEFSGGSKTNTASGNGLGSLQALAVDSANNLWVANGDGSVSAFTSSGAAIGHWSLSGTGAGTKDGIAVDASGGVFASNSSGNAISLFTQTGGLLGTYSAGGMVSPQGLAPDSSGNLWVANEGDNSVTEFVGLAAPTVTPIAGALQNGFTP